MAQRLDHESDEEEEPGVSDAGDVAQRWDNETEEEEVFGASVAAGASPGHDEEVSIGGRRAPGPQPTGLGNAERRVGEGVQDLSGRTLLLRVLLHAARNHGQADGEEGSKRERSTELRSTSEDQSEGDEQHRVLLVESIGFEWCRVEAKG